MRGRTIDLQRYKETLRERNFIERNKALVFLEAVLTMEKMHETQSNLEEKYSPIILKDDFSSRKDSSIFTSIAPELLD